MVVSAAAAHAQHYPILPVSGSPHGISALMQDSRSAVWIGTVDDVVCFDGTQFYSLRPYGFPREKVQSLAEDGDGTIWIATSGSDVRGGTGEGGLYRYRNGHVEKVASGDTLSVVTVAPHAMLASFPKADMNAYGDFYLVRKQDSIWKPERILQKAAIQITVDHKGAALFPCPGGWCEFSRKQLVDWPHSGVAPTFGKLAVEGVARVLRDRFNCVWFRGEETANYRCPGDDATRTVPAALSGIDTTKYLAEDADGSILMLGGVSLGRPGAFRIANFTAQTALIEKDGTILLGAEDGLHRFMYPFRLEYWDQADGPGGVLSILRLGEKVFAAINGVTSLSADRSKWIQIVAPGRLPYTVHLIPGPNGTILAASLSRGVTQIDTKGKILASTPSGVAANRLASDSEGRIWLAERHGISRVSIKGSQLILSPEADLGGTSLDMKYEAPNKTLWACHTSEVLGLRNGAWLHITRRDGLLDNYCRSITVLPNGDVWMAYGEFSAFARIRGAFSGKVSVVNYTSGEDVGDAHTNFLDRDSRGWLWRASEHDNYLATPESAEQRQWLHLDGQDGIPDPGGNQNSFYSDPDGSVWFSNDNSIVHFTPPVGFATRFPPPAVFIGGLQIGANRPVLAETVSSVPHGKSVVAHIGSLQFNRRNALRFRYRLLPGDHAWKETANFVLPLGKLAPGRHTLEVQGRLFTGEWSEIASSSFSVLWPVWFS